MQDFQQRVTQNLRGALPTTFREILQQILPLDLLNNFTSLRVNAAITIYVNCNPYVEYNALKAFVVRAICAPEPWERSVAFGTFGPFHQVPLVREIFASVEIPNETDIQVVSDTQVALALHQLERNTVTLFASIRQWPGDVERNRAKRLQALSGAIWADLSMTPEFFFRAPGVLRADGPSFTVKIDAPPQPPDVDLGIGILFAPISAGYAMHEMLQQGIFFFPYSGTATVFGVADYTFKGFDDKPLSIPRTTRKFTVVYWQSRAGMALITHSNRNEDFELIGGIYFSQLMVRRMEGKLMSPAVVSRSGTVAVSLDPSSQCTPKAVAAMSSAIAANYYAVGRETCVSMVSPGWPLVHYHPADVPEAVRRLMQQEGAIGVGSVYAVVGSWTKNPIVRRVMADTRKYVKDQLSQAKAKLDVAMPKEIASYWAELRKKLTEDKKKEIDGEITLLRKQKLVGSIIAAHVLVAALAKGEDVRDNRRELLDRLGDVRLASLTQLRAALAIPPSPDFWTLINLAEMAVELHNSNREKDVGAAMLFSLAAEQALTMAEALKHESGEGWRCSSCRAACF